MKALPGKRNGFQKLIGNLRKFAGAIIPGSGVYIAETQKEIHEEANENNRHLQERREAIQLKQMELSALQYHDNKAFQAEMAQARHQQNLAIERSRQAANERLAELNYQRNAELQKANQAFQIQLAQLSYENQQKLQQYRAMLELAIQDKNLDFQKWRLEQEKVLQLEIISLRQEFDRELAKYNRETALNNIREQRRLANSPINLVSDDLLESPYRDGNMPLRVLLSPPELNYDSFGQKSKGFDIESHLAEELREFLNENYPFNGDSRQTQLLDGAWVSKKFKGGSGIQTLHSQLKAVPIVVLESEVDDNYLNFRVAYWRGDGGEFRYSSILSKFAYRDFLHESAKDRAKKWAKTKQQLMAKGRSPEQIKAIGGDNEFNLFILQEEQKLMEDGIDLSDSDISQQYKIKDKDFQKLHRYLITFHCLTVGLVADIHYLSQACPLTPVMPFVLPELLQEIPESSELQTTMLDWLIATYNEIYQILAEVIPSWIPELTMQFAIALSHLEDKSYALEQGKRSVKAWLRLHEMETIDRKALHSIVTKDDEPYFKYLQKFLNRIGDINNLSEAKILLDTWLILQDLGIVKDKSTLSTDDFFRESNNHAEDIFNKAFKLSENKQYEKALIYYDKYLKFKPDSSGAWFNRGGVLRALNKYEEAIASYDRAFHCDPTENMCLALIYKAQSLKLLNRKEEAISAYDKALKIRLNDAITWMFRGELLRSLERYEEAIFSYDNAIKFELIESEWTIEEDWKASVWRNRGNIFKILKDYDRAIASYDQVIRIRPNSSEGWLLRGKAYMQSSYIDDDHIDISRWQNAIDDHSKAIFLDSNNAESYFGLGICYRMLNEKQKAIESYQRAATIYHAKGKVEDYCTVMKMLNILLEENE